LLQTRFFLLTIMKTLENFTFTKINMIIWATLKIILWMLINKMKVSILSKTKLMTIKL